MKGRSVWNKANAHYLQYHAHSITSRMYLHTKHYYQERLGAGKVFSGLMNLNILAGRFTLGKSSETLKHWTPWKYAQRKGFKHEDFQNG